MLDPIIIFALPRSGSTLFMRLMNKCSDSSGKPIVFTGETEAVHAAGLLFKQMKHLYNRTHVYHDPQTQWNPHYVLNDFSDACDALRLLFRKLSGCYSGVWGFKEVNNGQGNIFPDILDMLITLFPGVRFIFHTRNQEQVLDSMLRNPWWPEKTPDKIRRRLNAQEKSFRKGYETHTQRSFQTDYRDLLDYGSFVKVTKQLDLAITAEDYYHTTSVKL